MLFVFNMELGGITSCHLIFDIHVLTSHVLTVLILLFYLYISRKIVRFCYFYYINPCLCLGYRPLASIN